MEDTRSASFISRSRRPRASGSLPSPALSPNAFVSTTFALLFGSHRGRPSSGGRFGNEHRGVLGQRPRPGNTRGQTAVPSQGNTQHNAVGGDLICLLYTSDAADDLLCVDL